MGTIKNGITGGFSGKVGNIVGASWRGIAYLRSLPANMHNPRTEKQLTQRSKFSLIGRLLKALKPIIRVGFKSLAGKGKSAFSMAMKLNIENAVTGQYPDFGIDWSNLLIATGDLYPVNSASAACVAGSLDFTWDNTLANTAKPTDRVMLVACNASRGKVVYNMDAAARADTTASIPLPPFWDGEQVECYLVFVSEDGSMVADSFYAGSVTATAAAGG